MARRQKQKESGDPADDQGRPDKPSYAKRLGDRARVVGSLSETLVREPKSFPKKTAHAMRPWFRKVWKARGGGLYACGFVLTFAYLEASMMIGEIMAATGVVSFFTEQLLELPLRFVTESFGNLIQAFIWPLPLLEFSPPWGFAILAVIYLVFANFIKKPLEQWLFENGD